MTNTRVDIGDDCFSPKPNTTNIFVQNLWCNNTHGVSMGSIGQYSGVEDIIENAWVENVTLLNGQVRPPYIDFIGEPNRNLRTASVSRLGLDRTSALVALTTSRTRTFTSKTPTPLLCWISATSTSTPPRVPSTRHQSISPTLPSRISMALRRARMARLSVT